MSEKDGARPSPEEIEFYGTDAAKWLAWRWLVEGPAALIFRAKAQGKSDDLIQVSNFWPRAARSTEGGETK